MVPELPTESQWSICPSSMMLHVSNPRCGWSARVGRRGGGV